MKIIKQNSDEDGNASSSTRSTMKIRTDKDKIKPKKRSGKVSSCKLKSDNKKIKTILKEEI